MPNKSIPTLGDSNWGTPLNNHIAQLQSPIDGSINKWLNTASRPAGLTADDQGKTGINLDTGLVEQWNGATWINLTKMGLFTVNSIFEDLVNINPVNTTRVYTAGYWTKDDFGGGVFEWDATSTKDVDGGRYFASKISTTGRWVRKMQDNVNVLHYGALPARQFFAGANGNYGYGGIYFRNDIPQTRTIIPISSKFNNIADAQSWYPRSVTSLSDAIDAIAIQSTIEFNSECKIPEGLYILNKPIQILRHRKIEGSSELNTVLHFIDCSGLIPKISVQNNNSDNNFVYFNKVVISNLSLIGNGLPMINDRLAAVAFNDNYCGINFPNIQTSPEASSNLTPLAYSCKLEHITIDNFAGHGLKMLSEFTCSFDFINVSNCGGHGIYLQGGNTTSLRNCYVSPVGVGYASYRILAGANMISCNGNDSPQNIWGIFGQDTALGDDVTGGVSTNFNLTGCNLEGMKIGIELRGNNSKLNFDNCQFYPDTDINNPYFIIDKSYQSSIIFNNSYFFERPVGVLKALINANGNNVGSTYMFIGKYINDLTTSPFNKVIYTNSSGVNTYGTDVSFDIPVMSTSIPEYGVKTISVNDFSAKSIYLGKSVLGSSDSALNYAQILTGDNVPTLVASDGSIYLRTGGGIGPTLFTRTNGVWVAK